MAYVQAEAIDATFDHKFARDLIRFVLRDHMKGLHWIPTGIFIETDLDSPLTPQFKAAIKEKLDFHGHTLHELFDDVFPDKSLVDENYFGHCEISKNIFTMREFDFQSFVSFSVHLAFFAGLSHHYGVNTGPFDSYMMIVRALRDLKRMGKLPINFWMQMQNWLENREVTVWPWVSRFNGNI